MSTDSVMLIVGSAVLVIGVGLGVWYVVREWRKATLTAAFVGRWWPALVEMDEWFALMEFDGTHSHFFQRHSPVLTSDEIWQRAQSGEIPFSGTSGRSVSSARWLFHRDLLQAIQSANAHWESGSRPKGGAFNFEFDHDVGEGYRKRSSTLETTRFARVIVRKATVVTAYPVLDSKTSARSTQF